MLWLLFGYVCLLGFVQERYKKPVISVCCWHVHCEECWLHTLVTCNVHTFTCLDMYRCADKSLARPGRKQATSMSKSSWMMDSTRSSEMPSCSAIDLVEIRRSSKISSWIWSIISGVVGLRTYQHPDRSLTCNWPLEECSGGSGDISGSWDKLIAVS